MMMKQWIRDIGLAMLIVLAITTFIKPTIVHGTSMNPTLQDGDDGNVTITYPTADGTETYKSDVANGK